MFRTVPVSIISSLFIVQSAVVYVIKVCRQLSSRTRIELQFHSGPAIKGIWPIPLLSVQWINCWWWAEELPETWRVSWQNKFVKLVHLVGFIIKKFVTMQVTWTLKMSKTIQGVSRGICNTLGNDSMCDSKQKSSYEHGSDFERLPRYDKKKIRTILRARTAIT